ncbi:MAG: hypothetical protein EOP05_00220 [Proteobacteria bacterium]|nr:MAG: hypothetical protein EOP05_00220 [Pseudomonadota bacterium]
MADKGFEHISANILRLIMAPMSNQEAYWLSSERKFMDFATSSQIYMLAQREEILFANIRVTDGEKPAITFDLEGVSFEARNIRLELNQPFFAKFGSDFDIEYGPKVLKFIAPEHFEYLTIEKLAFAKSHAKLEIEIPNLDTINTFRLHYVGISKDRDSMRRLFADGHQGRTNILTNGFPIKPGARLTDELFILLFAVETLQFKTYAVGGDFSKFGDASAITQSLLVADAEKAFLKFLKTEYNTETFENYPKGRDGLYNLDLDGYMYSLGEDLKLTTDTAELRGSFEPIASARRGMRADCIVIRGNTVTLVRAG